ncbi:DUF192 domain-containing protein [Stakelama tenebrarum]|uniref:DUF192 domain-containing protein n=1 Tax=Stakelama tenebrarum TaxID=2711215 RepID=A0A6G6Y4G6_9SPHN|nr:DUF192 domain-containing protein [Sphingosinithalassobacter tenebrarum]QIG79789.1 DUF192 domain-containing protein [Sphingosinithalassobacter tenebrarum]
MIRTGAIRSAVAAAMLLALSACSGEPSGNASAGTAAAERISVTVTTADGTEHVFNTERAITRAQQDRGYMYRTDIGPDDAMLFYPYPAEGGGPREASFWMKNTPMPLDIIFIRSDGSIARIAENTIPYSSNQIRSGEPVSAVLEVVGGRTAELGISPGDTVSWPGQGGG